MDYATKDNRAATAAQKQKAKAAASKRRAFPAATQSPTGCRRSAERQAAIRSEGTAAYGFLRCAFLPHWTGKAQSSTDPSEEHDFYASYTLLCSHYNLSPMETRSLGYPYGKAVALWAVEGLLKGRKEIIEITEVRTASQKLCLQAKETYNTGNTLYYIPLMPLHALLQDYKTKRAAQLLLAACCYLYQVAGIPCYTDEDSYLFWQYGMIREWVEDDPEGWEQDSYNANRSQLNAAEHIGNLMLRRMRNSQNLNRLAVAVREFAPLDRFGCDCLAVAEKVLRLWQDYPQGHLYCHADREVMHGDDDNNEGECIMMDKYIGFCAATEGWLYHTLAECVNNEFNECSDIQQPVLTRTFDGRAQDADSLDFDCRLFGLIDELCYILNTTDYGKP